MTVFTQSPLRRLASNTMIYGLGSVLNRFIGFLLLPLFTSYLTPEEYGVAALLAMVAMLVVPVMSLGFGTSMAPCYFEGNDRARKDGTVWTAFTVLGIIAILLITTGGLVKKSLSTLVFNTPDHQHLVYLTLMNAALSIVSEPFNLYLRFEERARTVVVLNLLSSLATIGLSVWMVVGLRRGISGLVEAWLIGQFATFVLFLAPVALQSRYRFDPRLARYLLSLGIPMIPGFAFVFVIQQANKYILQEFHGLATVGVYNVGFNIGMAMSLAVTAFQSAWAPFFMSYLEKREEAVVLFGRVMTYYAYGFGGLCLLFFLGARPVVMLMTQPPFHDAFKVVGFAAAAELFRGVFLILLPGMYLAREVTAQVVVQFFAAAVAVAVNFALIPHMGLGGGALGLSLGAFSLVAFQQAWNLYRSPVYIRVQYEKARLLRFTLVFVLVAGVSLAPRSFSFTSEIAWAATMGVMTAAVLWTMLLPAERAVIKALVSMRGERHG